MSSGEGRPEPDARLTLAAGAALIAVGLWLLLGRPGISGLGITAAGVVLAVWSLWRLLAARD